MEDLSNTFIFTLLMEPHRPPILPGLKNIKISSLFRAKRTITLHEKYHLVAVLKMMLQLLMKFQVINHADLRITLVYFKI